MNTIRLRQTEAQAALALGMSLAMAIGNGALAAPPGGGAPAPAYSVHITGHAGVFVPASPLYSPDPFSCPAVSDGSAKSMGVRFHDSVRHNLCMALDTTLRQPAITDDISLPVRTDKTGKVLGVRVRGQDIVGEAGLMHQSDEAPCRNCREDNPEGYPPGSFILHVHGDGIVLWKCDTHLMRKNTRCNENVGTFAIGDLVYVPSQ